VSETSALVTKTGPPFHEIAKVAGTDPAIAHISMKLILKDENMATKSFDP
jgi:hypothetical protein